MITTELREARQRMGLTLADLSDLTNIAQPNLSRLERGRVDPRLSTLERVAGVLGLELTVAPYATSTLDAVRSRMQRGAERLSHLGITDRRVVRRFEWKRQRGIDTSVEEELLG